MESKKNYVDFKRPFTQKRKRPGFKKQNTEPLPFKRLFNYTLWLLGRRNYHSAELKEKLKKKGATKEQIDQILQKLSDFKYLNDTNFIASYLNFELSRKPQGLYLLKQKLLQKKIPQEEIDMALENFQFDEEEQIKRALQKKKINLQNLPDTQEKFEDEWRKISKKTFASIQKEKLFRFLQARGFSVSTILKILE